jgi:hypothetical protein
MVKLNAENSNVEMRTGAEWEPEAHKLIRALIVECGSVSDNPALTANLRAAKRLALIRAQHTIVAVGAIKTPQASYRQRVG